MDTAADFRLVSDPSRGGGLTVGLLTAMIFVGYIGINLLYERFNPSPDQIFDSLRDATFDQHLPAGLAPSGGAQNQRSGNGYVSVHLNTPERSPTMKGPQVVIAYEIFPDEASSTQRWEESLEGLRSTVEVSHRSSTRDRITFEAGSLPVSHDNVCVSFRGLHDYCQIRVGSVWIDISSRLVVAGLGEETYYPELAVAALHHLRESVPSVDSADESSPGKVTP